MSTLKDLLAEARSVHVDSPVQHLTGATFDEAIAAGPILVDFWAPWCGPCRAIAPVLEEIPKGLTGEITIGKVNVDEEPALAARFGIQSIPTLKFFTDGEVAGTLIGAMPKVEIVKHLEALRD